MFNPYMDDAWTRGYMRAVWNTMGGYGGIQQDSDDTRENFLQTEIPSERIPILLQIENIDPYAELMDSYSPVHDFQKDFRTAVDGGADYIPYHVDTMLVGGGYYGTD